METRVCECGQTFVAENGHQTFCGPDCREHPNGQYATEAGYPIDPARCPLCHNRSKVLRSRAKEFSRLRRRWCKSCGFRWNTEERVLESSVPA